MKKRTCFSLTGLLLAAALLLSGCLPALLLKQARENAAPEQSSLAEGLNLERQQVDFSSLEYVRPDLDAMDAHVEQAMTLVGQKGKQKELLALYQQIIGETVVLDSMDSLASIRFDLDLTDESYEQESLDLDEYYTRFENRLLDLTGAILDSEYGDAARKAWGEGFVQRYEFNRKLNSPAVEDLKKQEQELINDYNKRMVEEFTTTLNGETVTIDDLDLTTEEGIYAYYEIYEKRNKALGEIYLKLVPLRIEMAEKLGYDSYTDYAYDLLGRDFTKEDAAAFSEKVKKVLVPIYQQIDELYYDEIRRASQQGDVSFEDGLPILRKALQSGEFPEEMQEALDYMLQCGLYDFGDDPNMKQAGYTTYLTQWKAPYMLINTDIYSGPDTLFHEFGHYYNFYLMDSFIWGDAQNLDLSEIHSQALEVLMYEYYPDLYGEDAELFEISSLDALLYSVLSGCMEDEFQQIIFENPDMTLDDVNMLHAQLNYEYFGYPVLYEWVEIHHHTEAPFYYISYATSAISTLEIWERSLEDREGALEIYDQITRYNVNAGYLEPLKEVGLKNPFTSSVVNMVAGALSDWFALDEQENAA